MVLAILGIKVSVHAGTRSIVEIAAFSCKRRGAKVLEKI